MFFMFRYSKYLLGFGFVFFSFTIFCQTSNIIKPSNTIFIDKGDDKDDIITKAANVIPNKNQYEALKDEFIAFIHFGPNTFTRMEWGTGKEDPKIFDLKNLDTDQWCKAIKDAGMTKVIFTAKHHDGFCLWQTRYTKHSVASTNFRNGKGDVLADLAKSCQKYGLKLGIYLSPADLYQIENPNGIYGNLSKYTSRQIPRSVDDRPFENKTRFNFVLDDYNEYFANQLFELLTEYGPVHEVWFDGAHPKRKGGQKYNYLAWKEIIKKLAPNAVVFGKEDIRWCGNESGKTRRAEYNVIPYQINPNTKNHFLDITGENIGDRKNLYEANYLHYQPAETNTSIREGWFYRDDNLQRVRTADDVFDIYERSVGGNSIFLLNIPPNREGRFSNQDIKVLKELGNRIRDTYSKDLFDGAKGDENILDDDIETYILLDDKKGSILIEKDNPITINRLVIQEAIKTHSERIEKHHLDAWIDNKWEQIATAENVGYKRILRFNKVTSNKFRIRVSKSRLNPAISNISAHYYKPKPPELMMYRDIDGRVHIKAKTYQFNWKNAYKKDYMYKDIKIKYTTDGSIPNKNSNSYIEPFFVESKRVKAFALSKNKKGPLSVEYFGIVKNNWKLVSVDSNESDKHKGQFAFDEDENTYWLSSSKKSNHHLTIYLGKTYNIIGFAYTPNPNKGIIKKGVIKMSLDGKYWQFAEDFEFGNIVNDPTKRYHYFKKAIKSKYIKIITNNKQTAISEIDLIEK